MSKQNYMVSENEKLEIAKELGVYEKVKTSGWKDVSSKDCGNIVKKALEMAERNEKDLKLNSIIFHGLVSTS